MIQENFFDDEDILEEKDTSSPEILKKESVSTEKKEDICEEQIEKLLQGAVEPLNQNNDN